MRLFVAIDLPEVLRQELATLALPSGCRALPVERIHLTLKFLGEVPDEKLEKVKEALAALPFSPFTVQTTKIGTFPGVLWLGVKLTKELAQLRQAIQRAVRPFALNDPRSYKPHLTLARFQQLDEEGEERLALLCKRRLEQRWKANAFILYRSTLTEHGLVYEALARFPSS